jgi:Galactosyltransferase
MNSGKSQTWFYYAGTVLDRYGIDYVMKIDTDSLLYLDRYFKFAESSLPPSPYNTRILAGVPIDKKDWQMDNNHIKKTEPYFDSIYGGVHIYAAGQMYIISKDIANGVANVAANDNDIGEFAEGHEDHDISAMAFLSLKYDEKDKPIKFILLPLTDPFWKHPLKIKAGVSKWKEEWDNVVLRIKQDSNFRVNSTSPSVKSNMATNKRHCKTKITTDVPIIYKSDHERWIQYLETNNTEEMIPDRFKFLNTVQINNSIATNHVCFLNSGYLQRPLHVIQLTAPHNGGVHWDKLAKFILERFPMGIDVITLIDMDVGMARSNYVHTVQLLAESLQMNFAWSINTVQWISPIKSPANKYGYSGPAILSKCQLYDPYIAREFNDNDSINTIETMYSNSGLFVRMASDTTISTGVGHHIITGSVSNIDLWKNRNMIWEYQYGYSPTTADVITGVPPSNQLGSIIGGELNGADCEQLFGLRQLTVVPSDDITYLTFPANCHTNTYGTVRADNICSNLMLAPSEMIHNNNKSYAIYLPCLDDIDSTSPLQLSNHSFVFAAVH